jgi:hypothetical protein
MRSRRFFWLTLAVLVLYALHQDGWNWDRPEPLIFGFLPVGLAYHAAYSLAAAALMGCLVRFAWPAHLEGEAQPDRPQPARPATEPGPLDTP